MRRRQLVILGAGPAGYVAALRAAQLGAQVTVVEKQWLGGVCLNVGCIPTKAMLKSAEVFETIAKASAYGIIASPPQVDWPKVLERKNQVVSRLTRGVEILLKKAGVEVLYGSARFLSNDTIEIKSLTGLETIVADRFIIAAGSRPALPPIQGLDGPAVLDSTAIMSLPQLPQSLAVIGAGAIGLEWASLMAAFGVEVSVIEMAPRILPLMDEDLSASLAHELSKRGIKLYTSTQVKEIKTLANGVQLILQGMAENVVAQKVLCAVGRWPNLEDLDLDRIRLAHCSAGIEADKYMRTSIPGIYVAGDIVAGTPKLAHLASRQGIIAVENALGYPQEMQYHAVPSCVYTLPPVAGVGLSASESAKMGHMPKQGRFDLVNNGMALALGEEEGFVKVVADENCNLVGLHILGAHASDLILEGALAVSLNLNLKQMHNTIHPHPSLGEAIHEAALAVEGKALHLPQSRK